VGKFTRKDIQQILTSGAGLDLRKARELTARIIEALTAALTAGETVKLRGLGTLDVRERAERRARKPRTGEEMIVPARRYVFFTPGRELKASLRKPAENQGPGPSPEYP
jgi:nucleoid DNA-binding protein